MKRLKSHAQGLITFCRQRPVFCIGILIAIIIFLRIVLPLRIGMFGPDESTQALEAQSILKGASIPLCGVVVGSFGIPYGVYATYFTAFIYGITGFNLGWSLFIASIIALSAPFFLALYVPSKENRFWTFLFALTSPLAIHYSFCGLWSIPVLIPLSAIVLYIGRPSSPQKIWKEFLIGLFLGIGLGIHPQTLPFVAGIFVWRILVTRRKAAVFSLIMGIFLAALPYLIGLWQTRGIWQLTLSPRAYPPERSIISFFVYLSSLFRFWGVHSRVHMFPPRTFLYVIESILAVLTVLIAILLIYRGAKCFWKTGRKHFSTENPLFPALLCAAFYMPFAFVTNTGFQPQNGMALWWFAPLVIPPIITAIFPKRAAISALWYLIAFNLIIVAVQYTPKVINGTDAYFAYGQGPSWWAYEEVVSDIYMKVNNQRSSQGDTIVEMSGNPYNERIRYILANLMKLRHPDCAKQVQFIWSDTSPGRVLRVEPDPDKIHLNVFWVKR